MTVFGGGLRRLQVAGSTRDRPRPDLQWPWCRQGKNNARYMTRTGKTMADGKSKSNDLGVQNRGADSSSVPPAQAVPLVGVPSFPNCIKWSEENLLAAATGHLVTILNPASMSGPRGFIPIATSPVFNLGKVHPEDLQAPSLLQFCLARDQRPGVRSIDWSPPGFAQNGGCLLAMCTTDSRVKVYRAPFCDFQSEWVEILDLSEMAFNHCLHNDFREADLAAAQFASEEEAISSPLKWGFRVKRKLSDDEEPQHRKVQKTSNDVTDNLAGGMDLVVVPPPAELSLSAGFGQDYIQHQALFEQAAVASNEALVLSPIGKGSRVEVLEEDDGLQYWVGASVVEIVNGEVLVRLDQPQYGAMQEWVPLHDQISIVHELGQQDGKQFSPIQRPRIRPLVPMDTLEKITRDGGGGRGLLARGELVEAWINQRWQEGMVLELDGSGVIVKFSASPTNTVMELEKLRLAPFWHGKQWVYKTTSAVSNHRTARASHSNNDALVSTMVENCRQVMVSDSREEQNAGQRDTKADSLACPGESGDVTASLTLDTDQNTTGMTGGQHDSPNLLSDSEKKCYSKVYKRRGPPLPPDSYNSETCPSRPARSRRLPSKFRSDNGISWTTEPDKSVCASCDVEHGDKSQDKDRDYLQDLRHVKDVDKAKQVRFFKDKNDVLGEISVKETGTLKVTKSRQFGDTAKQMKDVPENWIRAPDFAARSEMLAPLVLAWSCKYEELCMTDCSELGKAQKVALLGAGMKSGSVGFWRVACPPYYQIDQACVPVVAKFLGFVLAHESWVTTLSWASCCNFNLRKLNPHASTEGSSGLSGEALLLATGCADGSVKLWAGLIRELSVAPSVNNSIPFLFLRQVVKVDYVPVTSLALTVSPQTGDRALLAVGKGSGSVLVWELKSSGVCGEMYSQFFAHQQMVTGFSWTYDGRCLYSCGQDSLKCWGFSHDQLLPLPFPDGSVLFPTSTAPDLCSLEALESFSGVALSHNSLALAAVRGIASDMLDQMYQARSQKGMVQLFWLGCEHIDFSKGNGAVTHNALHVPMSISRHHKVCWELNIVAALERLQDPRLTLVLWDVVAALSLLREKIGVNGVISIFSKWLSSWAPVQGAVGAVDPYESSTGSFQRAIPQASCRKLHMLNVIYRRFFLSHVDAEILSTHSLEEHNSMKDDDLQVKLWKDRMDMVEYDLRQRLVHCSLVNAASQGKNLEDTDQGSYSVETQLLVKWVLGSTTSMFPQLVKVANQLCHAESSLHVNLEASGAVETCTFCDSPVPFESPDIATCCGSDSTVGASKHHLQRCSVSMQVCPSFCSWHCGCCGRLAVKQPSSSFLALSSRAKIAGMTLALLEPSDALPFCPFCGMLMYRLLPNFLLTPSLV